jgi:hypothetical protein
MLFFDLILTRTNITSITSLVNTLIGVIIPNPTFVIKTKFQIDLNERYSPGRL